MCAVGDCHSPKEPRETSTNRGKDTGVQHERITSRACKPRPLVNVIRCASGRRDTQQRRARDIYERLSVSAH